MLNAIIAWSLRHRLIVLAATLTLVMVGWWSLANLNIDAFPDTTPVQVQINSVAPGLVETKFAGALVRSPAGQRNWDILCARWSDRAKDAWLNDGLNSLRFTQIARAPIDVGRKRRDIVIERVLVDFLHRPGEEGVVPPFMTPNGSRPSSPAAPPAGGA